MLKLGNLKGTKDFSPEEQRLRNEIKEVCEKYFNLYGFKPLETPILNSYEIMAYKYGGGGEILKEVYQLKDQGDRDLALRYDLTVPFTKYIGLNSNEIRLPFKRYEVGKVFRNGPVKTGRLREFTQCDCDIVGIESVTAEAELMTMAVDVFKDLNIEVVIQFNNRKLLAGILTEFQIKGEEINDVILTLDKLEKIGISGIKSELTERKVDFTIIEKIVSLLQRQELSVEFFEKNFSSVLVNEGLQELKQLSRYLVELGINDSCVFNPFLARGLSIYTGTIYEIFLKDGSFTSALGSGGRYDAIIGQFLNDDKNYPTVGLSFGLDAIFTVLQDRLMKENNPFVEFYLIPIETMSECLKLARKLRSQGFSAEVEMSNRKLKNALNYANKENIPYVLILGESELEKGVILLKDMNNRTEKEIPVSVINEKKIIAFLK